MNETRQNAWSKEEDLILAETVLSYIKQGKTQMEAFRDVASRLSRTAAACGFRWNATLRKEYHEEIEQAKEERKKGVRNELQLNRHEHLTKASIESAIVLLEKMKNNLNGEDAENSDLYVEKLKEENEQLKQKLKRYEQTVEEMMELWSWRKNNDT